MTTEDRETKMSKSSELWDRLSELPDTLILHILSLLPMSDVVRTTVLSKRWRGLWTSVPCLLFDAENKSSEEFRNFVNRAMLRWKGTELQKFSVSFCCDSKSFTSDIDTWLYVAIEKGVKELSVDLMKGLYSPPQSLYSCSAIRKASFVRCALNTKGNVQWDQLKSLRIELPQLRKDVIKKIMLGAPQMEILNLSFRNCSENLNIHSNSLKTLKIEKKRSLDFSTVRISTPNVETLEISGIYLKGNVSSLTRAKVGFRYAMNYRIESSSVYKVLKEMSENFFQNICHLEEVTLSGWSAKVFRDLKKEHKHMVAPLSNVKFLRLYASCVDNIVALLEIFPALTALVLLQEKLTIADDQFFEIVCPRTTTSISKFDVEKSLEPKSDFLVPYLRTVEITWSVHGNSIFPFIEILSENVRKLEKMVLRLTGTNSGVPGVPLTLILASQKLLSVQKAFPAADIIMCQD